MFETDEKTIERLEKELEDERQVLISVREELCRMQDAMFEIYKISKDF